MRKSAREKGQAIWGFLGLIYGSAQTVTRSPVEVAELRKVMKRGVTL